MIRLIIGINEKIIKCNERKLSHANKHWITKQINKRKAEGCSVCARVIITKENHMNIALSTAACPITVTGDELLNKCESELFSLWKKTGLAKENFTSDDLIAFLKQLLEQLRPPAVLSVPNNQEFAQREALDLV
ncbi:hypothetical protein H206_03493 [Candidatus Electrothrix aarhusensis]|jgi:hypothetical protein|uniref:Uncharacterized protein n=1 Tax=Candidatus Electrothrix aarhusensis TaxID=1859131 RepID=A0A3S3R5G1_9BACT|nr:hypothetical protein H206_03493 [Candidatus Electrothrix aarhusensis]